LTRAAGVTKTTGERAAGSGRRLFASFAPKTWGMAVASRAVGRTDDTLFVTSNSGLACGAYPLSDTCLIERIVA